MVNYYDEQLSRLQEQCARKRKLEAARVELHRQHNALTGQEEELKQIMAREQADVDRLEGGSLATFFYQVVGKMDEKLTAERQEAYAARVKYDAAARELAGVDGDLQRCESELAGLQDCESRYQTVWKEKVHAVKAQGGEPAEKILQLEERIAYLGNQRKELQEAVDRLLAQRRETAHQELHTRMEGLYRHCPALAELEREQAALLRELTAVALKKKSGDPAALRARCAAIDAQRAALLRDLGLDEDYLRPHYTCSRCQDTGFVEGKPCSCYLAALRRLSYETSPMGRSLRRQTFDNFDLSLYDDRPLPGGISPRQVMAKNLSTAKAFVQNFPDGGRSLLMTGPSGLGKTHLSSAIGGELAARGYHVVYEMAPTLLQKLEDVKFGRRPPEEEYQNCDLLIVDDLGSEYITAFSTAALFALLGERLVRGKPGIVSTNFSPDELEQNYTKKLASRLCYDYAPLFSWGRMCAGQSGRLSSARRARRRRRPLPKNKGRRSALFCPPPPLFSHAFWRCFPWIVQSPLFLSSSGAPFASAPSPSAAATP